MKKQNFEYLQDIVDSLEAGELDSTADEITFGGSWSGITSQNYEGSLKPSQLLGKLLRFQLEHNIPIIPRRDITTEGVCRRPPILPIYSIKPRVFSLESLTDFIKVNVIGFFDWHQNRRRFAEYLDAQRGGVPFFGIFFKKRQLTGFSEAETISIVKASAIDAGYLFGAGDNQDVGVDNLLVGLWRQMMEQRLPHYK